MVRLCAISQCQADACELYSVLLFELSAETLTCPVLCPLLGVQPKESPMGTDRRQTDNVNDYLVSIVENSAAEESDISLKSWQRVKYTESTVNIEHANVALYLLDWQIY